MHLSSMPLRLRPSSFSEGWKWVRDSALAAPNGLEDKHLTGSTLHATPTLASYKVLLHELENSTLQYHEVVPSQR